MVASVLLVLVFVNAFITGWLVNEIRKLKATISAVATAQSDFFGQDD